MNYIILDNEWNTVYNKANESYLNELIEIGAVKLDRKLNVIDTFSVLIKSNFTKKLCGRFKRLTHITNEEMLEKGISFLDAIKKYTEWVGEDSVTLTWSNSDIYAIIANMKYYYGVNDIPFITYYVDMQKYVQDEISRLGTQIKSQISVHDAAMMLEIDFDESKLHRALDDSLLCAEIFKKVYKHNRLKNYVVNTKETMYFDRLTFKPYVLTDINDPLVKINKLKFKCPVCNFKTTKVGEWKYRRFAFKSAHFCKRCKAELIASAVYKKNFDSVAVKQRIVVKGTEERKTKEMAAT